MKNVSEKVDETFSDIGSHVFSSNVLSSYSKTLLMLAALLSIIWWWVDSRKGRIKGIPGPIGIPILGNLLQMVPQPHAALNKFWNKYGDVYQIRMGSMTVVIINGIKQVRRAYTTHGESFSGRPDFLAFRYIGEGESLTFGRHRPEWGFHKKIARCAIRKFLKFSERGDIEKEAIAFTRKMQEAGRNGKFCPEKIIEYSVRSVTFSLVFGATSDSCYDDHYNTLMQLLLQFNDLGQAGLVPDLFPWTRGLFKVFGKYDQFRVLIESVEQKINELLDDHKESFDSQNIRDIADAFLQLADNIREYPNNLTARKLINTVQDLLGASESTLNAILSWSIFLLSSFTDVQKRVQEEIETVIGKEQIPHLSDRRNMPYTEATLLEILRYGCILPISLPHCTTRDTDFSGYSIPKDTVVFFNLWSLARDKTQWENASEFDPTRFIDKSTGRADTEQKIKFVPFGAGKRRCLGQLIAEEELFVFLVLLLQKCDLSLAPGEKMDFEGSLGLALTPKPYKINIHERV